MSANSGHILQFKDFTIDTDEKVLLREGTPVPLPPKVFETLLALIENHGRIVLKEELMKRLWPDTFVEEANLTFNIQQLRKSLGDNARSPIYIQTIARRGYRFIAAVEPLSSDNGEVQNTEPSVAEVHKTVPVLPAQHVSTPPQVKLPLIRTRPTAILAVIGVVVTGLALISWGVGNRRKSSTENHEGNGKPASSRALKLERLTANGQSQHVAISHDGKYVAYTRGSGDSLGIWVRQLATNTNVEIVHADQIAGLMFANSGESLYFVQGDPSALYRVSLLGGVPTKIVDRPEGKFSISADDRQIAFTREVINRVGQREYSLMVANSDGSSERTVMVRAHPDKLDVPLWSPDTKSIICAYGNSSAGGQEVGLVAVDVNSGVKKDLSSSRFFLIKRMDWLPGKTGLIISARKNPGDANQLFRVSYPGMEINQITEGLISYSDLSIAGNADHAAASQSIRESHIWVGSSRDLQNLKKITPALDNFCWTPGGQLVYSSTASGNTDIWIMQADGTEQRQLTVNAGVNGSPAATFDNRYIVFVSNRTGSFQIWRMNMDGLNQTQLTNGSGKNYPTITPDGKWVLYNSTDNWHLWKVSVEGGEPSQLTDFVASAPEVSPDGKMIACIGRNESKRRLLILPVDGGPVVKEMDFFGWVSRIQWVNDGQAVIYAGERKGRRVMIKQWLNGGVSEEPLNLDTDELFDFGYSADGRSFALNRGAWLNDLVLISGLND
ncbi:MAG TPA: winged helix-turn-helix domain-containing protein [Pyrinomonadaceae bacterium]|nr:winged helix-turn-helix domain-containing protein [Pyrinomonadaceae bacterium]